MNNEVDEFLDGLQSDTKEDPFKPENEDPFATKETKVEEVAEEEKVPFNKDPKIQRYIDKQISKRLADIQPTETERFREETKDEDRLGDALVRIVGNDTPEKISATKDLRNALGGIKDEVRQELLREQQQQALEEQRAVQEAQNELAEAFENIEDNFNVDLTSDSATARKTRGEFVDFIKRISPKNEDGEVIEYPDFDEAFTLFKQVNKPESNNRAKELASRSMERSTDASTTVPKDNSWRAVEKMFDKFKR